MNNSAFRALANNKTSSPAADQNGKPSQQQFKTPMLGSRARSSIPMTPRTVPGYSVKSEFARQVSEHNFTATDGPPTKRFKSSAAPKGSRLAKGYTDRAATLRGNEEATTTDEGQDDREKRLKALEEMLKLQQIDQETFDKLREDMGIGGDTSSTHLVKGLDWKLLERVRRGEDVTKSSNPDEDAEESDDKKQDAVDVEDELERALLRDTTLSNTETVPQDEEGPASYEEPQALTRDEILRRLKQSRNAPVKSTLVPDLGNRFKKVAAPEKPAKHKFVEVVNGRRREVLVINKKDGTTKRKTRWLDPELDGRPESQPLGMEVPAEIAAKAAQQAALLAAAAEEETDDIFEGVGADYDPLAGLESDSEDDNTQDTKKDNATKPDFATPVAVGQKRNYFATVDSAEGEDSTSANPTMQDPTILAALKRAADIRRRGEEDGNDLDSMNPEQDAKQKEFLRKQKERERQDAADLDYGFGESRFGDEEEDEDGIYIDQDGNVEGEGRGKKGGRKRGPRKRKGDKDSVQDVMGVLESRQKK